MTSHAFVDETKDRGYLVAAVVLLPDDLASARRKLTRLVLPGQRRLHFAKERDSRRRQILAAIAGLSTEIIIYDGSARRGNRDQRAACLTQLVCDLAKHDARLLVLERDDSILDADRRLLYRAVRAAGCEDSLRYQHVRAREEPLLAIPDAIAWSGRAAGFGANVSGHSSRWCAACDTSPDARNPARPPSGRLPGSLQQGYCPVHD